MTDDSAGNRSKLEAELRTMSQLLKAMAEQVARAEGRAVGAQLLATSALMLVLRSQPNLDAARQALANHVDRAVDEIEFGQGNPRLAEIAREAARKVCDECMASVARLPSR